MLPTKNPISINGKITKIVEIKIWMDVSICFDSIHVDFKSLSTATAGRSIERLENKYAASRQPIIMKIRFISPKLKSKNEAAVKSKKACSIRPIERKYIKKYIMKINTFLLGWINLIKEILSSSTINLFKWNAAEKISQIKIGIIKAV